MARLMIVGPWIVFGGFWLAAGMRVRASKRVEPVRSRLTHFSLMWVGTLLLMPPLSLPGPLALRLVPTGWAPFAIAMALTIFGIAFAIWARGLLGGNWSGEVTLKEGHQLIQKGPYSLVRHPIYTGLLLALSGTALAVGELRGAITIGLYTVAFLIKIRLEEKWLGEEFGEQYSAYRRRVKALIPFIL